MIYLDNAATTFPKPETVYRTMDEVSRRLAVNSGRGDYALAREADQLIQDTKRMILTAVNAAEGAEVVFTASATLACNQILGGICWKKTDVVYVSPYEHNAMIRVLYAQKEIHGFKIRELAIDTETLELDIPKIKYQFQKEAPAVIVMSHVSNVTGYILPIEDAAEAARPYEPIIILDASQAFCLVPVELRKMPVDFYVFAGHKTAYGPFGVGGFINNRGRILKPYLAGGTGSDSLNPEMPGEGAKRYEPGSMNILAVAGLNAALLTITKTEESISGLLKREQQLTKYLVSRLQEIPDVDLYCPPNPIYHVGIAAFCIYPYQSMEVGIILDEEYQIAVRTGYHCAPLIHKYFKGTGSTGVVRASLGRYTKKEEVDRLAEAVREIAEG